MGGCWSIPRGLAYNCNWHARHTLLLLLLRSGFKVSSPDYQVLEGWELGRKSLGPTTNMRAWLLLIAEALLLVHSWKTSCDGCHSPFLNQDGTMSIKASIEWRGGPTCGQISLGQDPPTHLPTIPRAVSGGNGFILGWHWKMKIP